MRDHLIIIGGGMAAARLINRLHALAPERYRITLVSAEPSLPYDRVQLSAVLAGERAIEDLSLLDPTSAERTIFYLGQSIMSLSRATRQVILADGTSLDYDKLVLATGSAPVSLPLPGADLEGVMTFRDLADVDALGRAAGRAIVIGGGLLGLEAANGLAKRGLDVTVVHLMPWLMERQLDREASELLRLELERRGIRFALGAESEAILGKDRVHGLRMTSGDTLPCDHLVMAVGVRPEKTLAQAAGLEVNRGVVVNDRLMTSDDNIFAIGECAEHRCVTYGLVWPVNEQADVLARQLAGEQDAIYVGSSVFTSLKISGIQLFSAGEFSDAAEGDRLFFYDPDRGIYKKLVVKDERLIGAVLLGDAADGAWYASLICERTSIADVREKIMFGRAFVEDKPASGPLQTAA